MTKPRVVIYCPQDHPAFKYWVDFCRENEFSIVSSVSNLTPADYLFLISCSTLFNKDQVSQFGLVCVIHESDLPKGRGWSPLAWQILEGKNEITVSAITCAEKVDSGEILAQRVLTLDGSELSDEIHEKSTKVKTLLVMDVLNKPPKRAQEGSPTYYPRRTPKDSELDPYKSFKEQFNLLRICEDRFPAYFDLNGHRYEVRLRKVS